jgi:phosphoribosylaminoimidazolecarboxamide formyltransferase/IMP cyclohydrolase
MPKTKYALISVYDKTGITELATHLEIAGYTVIATGNTYKFLKSAGITNLKKIDEVTGFPEILDGRVKTLHPAIFGGILSIRGNEGHRDDLIKNGISPIDFVVVNLYPFKEMKDKNITFEEKLEFIDIGGVSLLRAAAKNFKDVTVVIDPSFYKDVMLFLKNKQAVPYEIKKIYAYETFRLTAEYDGMIAGFLNPYEPDKNKDLAISEELNLNIKKLFNLRYGENPHQKAAFYGTGSPLPFEKLHGKEISYNNLLDIDSALAIINDFKGNETKGFFSVIIKHTNPCGAALSGISQKDAFLKARKTDEISSYGGIIGFNKKLDKETAAEIKPFFVEIIIAPDYSKEALKILESKKNTIIIKCPDDFANGKNGSLSIRSASGGMLLQEKDGILDDVSAFRTVTDIEMPESVLNDLNFAWKIAKHVKSNAIVYAKNGATAGIGAGQMSRIDSSVFAHEKMKNAFGEIKGFVMASDGFFPFQDSVEYAYKIGVNGIIQPGGSIRDDEVIAAANRLGIPMIFTNIRHFKH